MSDWSFSGYSGRVRVIGLGLARIKGFLSGRPIVRETYCPGGLLSWRAFVREGFCPEGLMTPNSCQLMCSELEYWWGWVALLILMLSCDLCVVWHHGNSFVPAT